MLCISLKAEVKIDGFQKAKFGMSYLDVKSIYRPLKKQKGMKGDVFNANIEKAKVIGKKEYIVFSFRDNKLFRVLAVLEAGVSSFEGAVSEDRNMKKKSSTKYKKT